MLHPWTTHQHYRHIDPSDGAFVFICIWVCQINQQCYSNKATLTVPYLIKTKASHKWNYLQKFTPNSYSRTLAFWSLVVFLKHTVSFFDAPVWKTLAAKKRYRGSPTDLQIIFELFALNLLWSLLVQPDYGGYTEKFLCALLEMELEFTEPLIPANFFFDDDDDWGFWFGFHFTQIHSKSERKVEQLEAIK